MSKQSDEEQLLAEFECIVCTEYIHPPIKMCSSGHSAICNDCLCTLTKCPLCQAKLLETRNITLEKVHNQMIFPCMMEGCTDFIKGSVFNDHKKLCKFNNKPCPLFLFGECKWMGNINTLVNHSEEAHPGNFVKGNVCIRRLAEDNFHPPDYRLRSLRFIKVLLSCFDELFIFTLKSVDVGLERTLYWCVFLISQPKENNFLFEIKFENDSRQSISFSGPCVATDWIRGSDFESLKNRYVSGSSGLLEKSDFDEYSVKIYLKD